MTEFESPVNPFLDFPSHSCKWRWKQVNVFSLYSVSKVGFKQETKEIKDSFLGEKETCCPFHASKTWRTYCTKRQKPRQSTWWTIIKMNDWISLFRVGYRCFSCILEVNPRTKLEGLAWLSHVISVMETGSYVSNMGLIMLKNWFVMLITWRKNGTEYSNNNKRNKTKKEKQEKKSEGWSVSNNIWNSFVVFKKKKRNQRETL